MTVITLCLAGILFLSPGLLAAEQKTIVIDSSPSGADVYWQGAKLGQTPLTVTPQTPGAPDFFKAGYPSYTLYLYKEFYETEIAAVACRNIPRTLVSVALKPLARLPLYDGVYARTKRLHVTHVVDMSLEDLAKRREEIYARYGRPIQDERFISYFKRTRWYKVNPLYADSMLTYTDKANIKLINDFLEVNDQDMSLYKQIIKQYEYRSPDGRHYIRFVGANTCVVGFPEGEEPDNGIVPYYYAPEEESTFVVAGGKIYIRTHGYAEVILDLDGKKLVRIKSGSDY
jgi:hypothetical protein